MTARELQAERRAPRALLARLESDFVRPHRRTLVLALAAVLGQSLLVLPFPLLQGRVLDRLVAPGPTSPAGGGEAWRLIAGVTAACVACLLAKAALGWWVGRVSQDVVLRLTGALHDKLQRLPMSFFDRHNTGRVMARITGDVGSVLIFLNGGFFQLLTDLVLSVGVTGLMLCLDWRLALLTRVTVPAYAVNHRVFTGRTLLHSRDVRSELAAIHALLSERVSAVRVVRSFAQEESELRDLDHRIDAHRGASLAGLRTGSTQNALATLLSGLGTVLVLTAGAGFVARGSLTVGGLLAFVAMVAQVYHPIVRLTQFHATVAATVVAVERMYEVLDEPEAVADRPRARPVSGLKGGCRSGG